MFPTAKVPTLCRSATAGLLLVLASNPGSAQDLADCEARWTSALERYQVPGLSVCAVQDGEVVYTGAFGVRDAEGHPVDPDTIFYIASTTKCVTGTAVCMLAEEGEIDLDGPVVDFLPRFELSTEEATRSVTIRDLLSHRRGLTAHPAIVYHDAYTGEITDDLFFRLLRHSTPTEHFEYSNLHFTLLGRVIEARTGAPWQDFLAERIFAPLGMVRTSARVSTFQADEDLAEGLDWDGERFVAEPIQKSDATMHAAGGMVTTATDLGRFALLHLGEGSLGEAELLRPDAVRAMQVLHAEELDRHSVFTRTGTGLSFALGSVDGVRMVGHNGGYVGFGCHLSFLPDEHVGVAVLVNGSSVGAQRMIDLVAADVYSVLVGTEPPTADWEELESQYRHHRVARSPSPPPVLSLEVLGPDLEAYSGSYVHEDFGTFEFEVVDGAMHTRNGLLHSRLHQGAEGEILLEVLPGSFTELHFDVQRPADGPLRVLAFETQDPALRFERSGAPNGASPGSRP